MMLPEIDNAVAEPFAPIVSPVIAACPVTLVIVLFDTVDVPPKPLTDIPVIAEVPPVQLLNILAVNVFTDVPASVCTQPAIMVAPVIIMFEKLLFV